MRRGRPSRPLAATFRDVEQLLREEPEISAAQVALRLGLRKQTAQIIVAGLRERARRFPKGEEPA